MVNAFTTVSRPGFAITLLDWFAVNMRPLPWRTTYDPYGIWVSEIMLQQTQAERGVQYYKTWMRRFPDIRSVAEANEAEVLAQWEGLGYYSRARNLHAAAKRIMSLHEGVFPQSLDAIRSLPGIGEYSAGAIASIAFNYPEPAVDANVLRIFSRIANIDILVTDKRVRSFVTDTVRALIPHCSPRLFNQGLMELGALICGKTPKCNQCPLIQFCEAHRLSLVGKRPVKATKTNYRSFEMATGIVERNGLIIIQQRPPQGLWPSLWEFPNCILFPGECPEQAILRHILKSTGIVATIHKKIGVVRHGYTTNKVTMHGYICVAPIEDSPTIVSAANHRWVTLEELFQFAFPAGQRKLLERLGWKKDSLAER